MDVWLWISELLSSPEWSTSSSPVVYQLASSTPNNGVPQSIQLQAEKVAKRVTFSICIQGFEAHTSQRTLWVSHMCSLVSDKPLLPLVVQLLQDIVDRSTPSSSPADRLKLKPDPVSWILETHSPESFSGFFAVVFLTRLFWLCALDAPTPVGSLYFNSFLEPNLELLARESHAPVMRAFFLASGVEAERCIARAVSYMLVKCLILRDFLHVGGLKPSIPSLGLSYATEAHGVWLLKSYAPVCSMKPTRPSNYRPLLVEAKESALRYSLAHQQLESIIQLEYSVKFNQDHIQVHARVDNLRFHILNLGLKSKVDEAAEYAEEAYFPSRIQVWIGPESGSNYVSSLRLGKSSGNATREVEVQRMVKGDLGKTKAPRMKATSTTSTRMKMESWRWDQDAQGNTVRYDGVLCEPGSGAEVYAMEAQASDQLRRRYTGGSRAFTKSKGMVVVGEECGEEVRWRVGKEMEGSVLKWRLGGKVWLSYWANQVESSYGETRCMEWCHEVDLPLIPTN